MTNFIYTIWALLLHCMNKSLFKTCFADALEDEHGNNFPFGPPMTSFIFAVGVYAITSNLDFYPAKFRKPSPLLMGLYEFLVTSFILEFSLACIWAPIDVRIYVSLTQTIHKIFVHFEYKEAAVWLLHNKYPMAILCYVIAIGFLLSALYVTGWSDVIANSDFKRKLFFNNPKSKAVLNLSNENVNFDESENDDSANRKKIRKKKTRKTVIKEATLE
ncbi:uncharacterized protein LOC106636876 [Copidosoma floridanum]|uniref:uncharacterized protein LOC106636876 n=1 Tax=Copidosoma floridanum TaxID=29053 RepID=UPI0006C9B66A|nr:uncharacterized protein LOC106636876 [Copidosoma floridanum]